MKPVTLVLGATVDPSRYAYLAIQRLRRYGHTVMAIGPKPGVVGDVSITQEWPTQGIDTVTLYVGPARQPEYYDRIIRLKPCRVIFNPGTENPELFALLRDASIEVVIGCTLVMLSAGTY